MLTAMGARFLSVGICMTISMSTVWTVAVASVPHRDMYLRARERRRQGSEVRQVQSAARFLWARSGASQAARDDGVFSAEAEQLICSIRRALPHDRGGEFSSQISTIIGDIIGHSAKEIQIALTDQAFCSQPQPILAEIEPLHIIHLDRAGAVVSSNPVWNACIRGRGITAALIRSNVDRSFHRAGHMKKWIPWSCRDYHKGLPDVWTHPDFPNLSIVLDDDGRLLSTLPVGYLAVKGDTVQAANSQ